MVVWSHGLVTSSRDFEFQGCLRKGMTVTYSQVPSQSQGIGTIPVTADTYRTEEVSGEGDRTKGGAEAIDHDVSSVPEPDHLGAGVPDDDDTREDVGALRREVLEVAEAATRGDEIAAVSAMVTAAETAALREAMGGPHVPPDHPRDPSEDEIRPDPPPEDEDKNAVAATFGARRRLNLEAVDHGADVWRGSSVLGGGVRGARLASASLSAGPDTQEALRDLGYSSRGWESVEASECDRSAATPGYAAGGPPSTIDSQGLSAAPRVSDGEGTQRKTVTFSLEPEEARERERERKPEREPDGLEGEDEDDEDDDDEDDDEAILATQAWDPAADDEDDDEEGDEDEEGEDDDEAFAFAGGTQAAPPESPGTRAAPSPCSQSPRPGLLRIREKPASALSNRQADPATASPYSDRPANPPKAPEEAAAPGGGRAGVDAPRSRDARRRRHPGRHHRLVRPQHLRRRRQQGRDARDGDAVDGERNPRHVRGRGARSRGDGGGGGCREPADGRGGRGGLGRRGRDRGNRAAGRSLI